MDKYEFKLKADEMKALVSARNYNAAAEIAETINWRKIRNLNALVLAGEVFEQVERYEESKEILLMAYDKSPIGRNIIYRLAEIAIKTKHFDEAQEYYDEFVDIAPHDNLKYVLKYKMTAAQGLSFQEQIQILEELKEQEYSEEWAYELAYLYHRDGQPEKCVEACDELILWFGDGIYVEKALELKMHYQPLTKPQEEKYRIFRQKRTGVIEVRPNDFLESGEIVNEIVEIPSVRTNTGQYNTANLQEEIARGIQQIGSLDEAGAESIRQLAQENPYLSMSEESAQKSARIRKLVRMQETADLVLGEESEVPERSMSFEEIQAEWEKTKLAMQSVLEEAGERELEPEKEKTLEEAEILMERLLDIVSQIAVREPPEEPSALNDPAADQAGEAPEMQDGLDQAGRIVASINELLQEQIDSLIAEEMQKQEFAVHTVSDPTRELPRLPEEYIMSDQSLQAAANMKADDEENRDVKNMENHGAVSIMEKLIAEETAKTADNPEMKPEISAIELLQRVRMESSAMNLSQKAAAGKQVMDLSRKAGMEDAGADFNNRSQLQNPAADMQQGEIPENAAAGYAQQGSISENAAAGYVQQEEIPGNLAAEYARQEEIPEYAAAGYVQQEEIPGSAAAEYTQQGVMPGSPAGSFTQQEEMLENAAGFIQQEALAQNTAENLRSTVSDYYAQGSAEKILAGNAAVSAQDSVLAGNENPVGSVQDKVNVLEADPDDVFRQDLEEIPAAGAARKAPAIDPVRYIKERTAGKPETAYEEKIQAGNAAGVQQTGDFARNTSQAMNPAHNTGSHMLDAEPEYISEMAGAGQEYASEVSGSSLGYASGTPGSGQEYASEVSGGSLGYTPETSHSSLGYALETPGSSLEYASKVPGSSPEYTSETPGVGQEYVTEVSGGSPGYTSEMAGSGLKYTSEASGSSPKYASEMPDAGLKYASKMPGSQAGFVSSIRSGYAGQNLDYGAEPAAQMPDIQSQPGYGGQDLNYKPEGPAPVTDHRAAFGTLNAEYEPGMAGRQPGYAVQNTVYTSKAMAENPVRQTEYKGQSPDYRSDLTAEETEIWKTDSSYYSKDMVKQKAEQKNKQQTEEFSEEDMALAAQAAGFYKETQQINTQDENELKRLTPEQKNIFSYFVPVAGMEVQIYDLLQGVSDHLRFDKNAVSGNIIVEGIGGNGKTVLIMDIIKVLQKEIKRPNGKIGKIDANALNQKDMEVLTEKVSGGCLIIESAGKITRETAVKLSRCMDQDHVGTLYILEDTEEGIQKALARDSSFAAKFTEKISIPLFSVDELVAFGKAYANDLNYDIDEMGILALYKRIGNIQKLDHVTTLTEVKEIVDEAIDNAEKGVFKKVFGILTATRANDDNYVILREKDFEE